MTTDLHEAFAPAAITAETRAINEDLKRRLAAMLPPADLAALRKDYVEGRLGLPASPRSPEARTMTINGPAGSMSLRVIGPPKARGVYLHLHGGGWIAGSNDTWDDQLAIISERSGMVALSLDYRLAPEHPFPAPVEDCVAAALWLIDNAMTEFGASTLAIGGESAGANLAASTLIRLRDMGKASAFHAANLLFGCYDLSLTPSARLAGETPFVNRESMAQFTSAFSNGHDLRDPAISPLYADLRGLPPALFTVGTIDPLLDDSLFMHMRWQAAGNLSELALYSGGTHGFNSFSGGLAGAANAGMAEFLSVQIDSDSVNALPGA